MRAIPDLLINNGGKGEGVQFPEFQAERAQKVNPRFRKNHFPQNRKLHATFRLKFEEDATCDKTCVPFPHVTIPHKIDLHG